MKNKIAILSHVLPPSSNGQAIMLYRLLEKTPKQDYILILSRKYLGREKEPRSSKKLAGKYYTLEIPKETELTIREYMKKSLYRRAVSFISTVRTQTKQLKSILISEKCETLVACTGGFFDLFAAYLAVRKLKIRFVIYSFDDYVYQWTGILRVMVRMIAKRAFKRADQLIAPNEFLQKAYFSRYGKKSVIVRNPYIPFRISKQKKVFNKKEINIVYTGSVYFAHFDAFRNLIKAIELLDMPAKLHIFTGQPKQKLEKEGISGRQVIFHKNVDQSETCNVQKQADILFLPLAFDSPIGETIKTSAPGKMGEYLSSGRPILVHAPKNSYISWYFKKNKCGVVADTPDPKQLAEAIAEMIKNKSKSKEFIRNAIRRAKSDFSLEKARKNFSSVISE